MLNDFKFFMARNPHNNHYTLLLENISLYFVLQQVFELQTFLCYRCQQTPSSFFFCFPSFYAVLHTFISERDCAPL
jgi:hypothetical protein